LRLLDEAAAKVGFDVTVELERIDVDGLLYVVSAVCPALDSRSKLTLALLEALASAEIPLGRNPARRE
jgi:hypothetical protein